MSETVMGEMLYEGKAKKVFRTDTPDILLVSYKDDATAFNGQKRGQIAGKGVVNNTMSNLLFKHLESRGVRTHFVQQLSERETLVHQLDMLKIEVVVRNLAAGSLAARLGLTEGADLPHPVVEFYYKRDDLGDPLINDDHAVALGLATRTDLDALRQLALQVNGILRETLHQAGVLLVDFKLEFGRTADGRLLLADEISPDTCRFWDAQTMEKLDKDRFRRDLGSVEDAYEEMLRRVKEVLNA